MDSDTRGQYGLGYARPVLTRIRNGCFHRQRSTQGVLQCVGPTGKGRLPQLKGAALSAVCDREKPLSAPGGYSDMHDLY